MAYWRTSCTSVWQKGESQRESPVPYCTQLFKKKRYKAPDMTRKTRPALGLFIFFATAFALGAYFTFAAVQGDFGLFRRAEIAAEARDLSMQLDAVSAEVIKIENLTKRLSDTYLDLDLLDEQARTVLGVLRADEIVIR